MMLDGYYLQIKLLFGALVSDVETSDADLTCNISAPPEAQGSVSGTGSRRTFDSADNFNGSVDILHTVTDRGDPDDCGTLSTSCAAAKDSATKTVTIDVTPANDAPTVEVAAGGSCGTNNRSGTINLTVRDPDGQAQTEGLTLSATSTNPELVPTSNVTFGGTSGNRTLTATVVSGKTGTATLTLTVSDGTATGTPLALRLQAGGNSNDTLTGTSQTTTLSGTDILLGQNGDDVLNGSGSNDLLCGGRGKDALNGEAGDDTMGGGQGADRFSGGADTDTVKDFSPSQGDTRDNTVEAF